MPRLFFSRFRPFFTRAGFDVVDCPRLTHGKNGADIRMVVDAMHALSGASYDEFVIASGDADMTALLVRLRAADRRTTIVSPSDAAEAFTAVADRFITGQDVLEVLLPESDAEVNEGDETSVRTAAVVCSSPSPPGSSFASDAFSSIIRERYSTAAGPMSLASLAHEVRRLGPVIDDTRWFGAGGFVRALQKLELPNVELSQHWLCTPADTAHPRGNPMPDPVAELNVLLALPRHAHVLRPAMYRVLAEYTATHHFSLTEATRWTRDKLVGEGLEVSRNAVGVVARGTAHGGCPLFRQPAPTAQEIAGAFAGNALARAEAAGPELSTQESDLVRSWFGATSCS